MKDKADTLIWWLMITFMSIIILGGGAWASSVNTKISEISDLKTNVVFIQRDISDLKDMVKIYFRRNIKGE